MQIIRNTLNHYIWKLSVLRIITQSHIKVKVKLATVVEGDQKAPVSIATTQRCRGGCDSSQDHSTLSLIHTLYCWVLSKEVSSTIFKVFGMMWPGIEPKSSSALANTLPIRPMSWLDRNRKYIIVSKSLLNWNSYLKPYICVQIIYIRNSYLIL